MENEKTNYQDVLLFSWFGPETVEHKRGVWWYLVMALVVAVLIVWAMLQNSGTMAIAIFVAAGVYLLYQTQPVKKVRIIISEMGIKIGDLFYSYNDLKSFYLEYDPPARRLYLTKKSKLMIRLELELPEDINPVKLREFLLTQLIEEEKGEQPFLDTFLRFIKF